MLRTAKFAYNGFNIGQLRQHGWYVSYDGRLYLWGDGKLHVGAEYFLTRKEAMGAVNNYNTRGGR